MKELILCTIALLLSIPSFAQSPSKYQHVIDEFVIFYNNNDTKGITSIIADRGDSTDINDFFTLKDIRELKRKTGKIKSATYMGIDSASRDNLNNPMTFFRLVCSKHKSLKETHAMAISLDKYNKIYGIRFLTTSPHVDSLLMK